MLQKPCGAPEDFEVIPPPRKLQFHERTYLKATEDEYEYVPREYAYDYGPTSVRPVSRGSRENFDIELPKEATMSDLTDQFASQSSRSVARSVDWNIKKPRNKNQPDDFSDYVLRAKQNRRESRNPPYSTGDRQDTFTYQTTKMTREEPPILHHQTQCIEIKKEDDYQQRRNQFQNRNDNILPTFENEKAVGNHRGSAPTRGASQALPQNQDLSGSQNSGESHSHTFSSPSRERKRSIERSYENYNRQTGRSHSNIHKGSPMNTFESLSTSSSVQRKLTPNAVRVLPPLPKQPRSRSTMSTESIERRSGITSSKAIDKNEKIKEIVTKLEAEKNSSRMESNQQVARPRKVSALPKHETPKRIINKIENEWGQNKGEYKHNWPNVDKRKLPEKEKVKKPGFFKRLFGKGKKKNKKGKQSIPDRITFTITDPLSEGESQPVYEESRPTFFDASDNESDVFDFLSSTDEKSSNDPTRQARKNQVERARSYQTTSTTSKTRSISSGSRTQSTYSGSKGRSMSSASNKKQSLPKNKAPSPVSYKFNDEISRGTQLLKQTRTQSTLSSSSSSDRHSRRLRKIMDDIQTQTALEEYVSMVEASKKKQSPIMPSFAMPSCTQPCVYE